MYIYIYIYIYIYTFKATSTAYFSTSVAKYICLNSTSTASRE